MTDTCKSMVFTVLDQLRWELVLQKSQLEGQKPSEEVIETAKNCVSKTGGTILPKIQFDKSREMDDQQYQEALSIFKEHMTQKRTLEIASIDVLMSLFENEVIPYPDKVHKILKVDAAELFNDDDVEGEEWKQVQ